ncbi:MAG: hypothetical protein GW748_05080 [Alphaproteobacteria bacterium]|nr:hypothetical protein [Alphaproteobacteria bacterium]NCQ67099.1 hypothetical protein [Alphaproteobacteria bacterium]NCT07696.1 hypothetical protein [Alphaproteobacteria bacterium]
MMNKYIKNFAILASAMAVAGAEASYNKDFDYYGGFPTQNRNTYRPQNTNIPYYDGMNTSLPNQQGNYNQESYYNPGQYGFDRPFYPSQYPNNRGSGHPAPMHYQETNSQFGFTTAPYYGYGMNTAPTYNPPYHGMPYQRSAMTGMPSMTINNYHAIDPDYSREERYSKQSSKHGKDYRKSKHKKSERRKNKKERKPKYSSSESSTSSERGSRKSSGESLAKPLKTISLSRKEVSNPSENASPLDTEFLNSRLNSLSTLDTRIREVKIREAEAKAFKALLAVEEAKVAELRSRAELLREQYYEKLLADRHLDNGYITQVVGLPAIDEMRQMEVGNLAAAIGQTNRALHWEDASGYAKAIVAVGGLSDRFNDVPQERLEAYIELVYKKGVLYEDVKTLINMSDLN